MMDKYLDNLISNIQELVNLELTQSAYVSRPLLNYILQWVEFDINVKKSEIATLKAVLIAGLDVDFTGTQWETEWYDNGKVCNCRACDVARRCISDIENLANTIT